MSSWGTDQKQLLRIQRSGGKKQSPKPKNNSSGGRPGLRAKLRGWRQRQRRSGGRLRGQRRRRSCSGGQPTETVELWRPMTWPDEQTDNRGRLCRWLATETGACWLGWSRIRQWSGELCVGCCTWQTAGSASSGVRKPRDTGGWACSA